MRARSIWSLFAGCLLTVACARAGVVETALHGDLQALKRDVSESQKRGELDKKTVEALARAVAGREVRSATGADAVDRIRSMRTCAGPLGPVLEDRSRQADDAAAEATLTLLELGKRDRAEMVRKYRDASGGAWRAIAARAAVTKEQGPFRRHAFSDPDERVRRGALRAAIDAASRDDLEPLLEAARLDPDAMSRSLATRAIGSIGGERAVLALGDQWTRADVPTRITIIDAWAMPAALRTGGEHELVTIAETKQGAEAIAAADALVRANTGSASIGVAVLVRAVSEGTESERRLAIQLVPLSDPDAAKAVEKAAKDDDKEVRVIALARLAGSERKSSALPGLRELAKQDDDLGLQARAALAAAGDGGVKAQLTALLGAKRAHFRSVAARGLLDLGDFAAAAPALADDDPAVRSEVACAVLVRRD